MGIVDTAKRQLKALQDRTIPQRVVFHHVPKCGGTSAGRALRKRYLLSQATVKPEESFRAFEMFTGRTDREAMLVDVLDLREQMMLYLMAEDVRCVSLHVRFSKTAHDHFADRYKFVTLLREPVARFISHYNWSYQRDGAFGRIDEPLEAFLDTPRARQMGATYGEYFSAQPVGSDFASDASVAAAVANLKKMDVVGRLDDLPGFEAQLRGALGVRIKLGHENRKGAARPAHDTTITPELRARIATLCAPDISIWKSVTGAES
ncbi:sulfotransferase family 2 domain-containing protein [Yoonia sp. R2331]|uniref:sulfotransferase family 2 domain-containing protein n=1 Tax=Yoonia sp. R2331 TaxID=3237238 RepID=UPI0034E540E6